MAEDLSERVISGSFKDNVTEQSLLQKPGEEKPAEKQVKASSQMLNSLSGENPVGAIRNKENQPFKINVIYLPASIQNKSTDVSFSLTETNTESSTIESIPGEMTDSNPVFQKNVTILFIFF